MGQIFKADWRTYFSAAWYLVFLWNLFDIIAILILFGATMESTWRPISRFPAAWPSAHQKISGRTPNQSLALSLTACKSSFFGVVLFLVQWGCPFSFYRDWPQSLIFCPPWRIYMASSLYGDLDPVQFTRVVLLCSKCLKVLSWYSDFIRARLTWHMRYVSIPADCSFG